MRDGNLSEISTPIIDPTTGSPFPGNIIPPDRMNAITWEVIQAYPLPNVSGVLAGNRIEVANHVQDSDDISIRIDHRLFGNTDMMARYSYGNARVLDPFWTDTPGDTNLLKTSRKGSIRFERMPASVSRLPSATTRCMNSESATTASSNPRHRSGQCRPTRHRLRESTKLFWISVPAAWTESEAIAYSLASQTSITSSTNSRGLPETIN